MKAFLNEEYFQFFKKLAANNHKDWFDENRHWYETAVKTPFENLVDDVLANMAKTDKNYEGVLSKNGIFRINRDVRFSKDKTPYKINRSAVFAPGGKKDMNPSGFYLEIGPEVCGIYVGVYMPEKDDLASIRNYIAGHTKEFAKIINEKTFVKTFGEVLGEKQKKLDPSLKNAAEIEPLIYNKQFYLRHEFDEKTAMGAGLTKYLIKTWEIARPFGIFMDKAMHPKNQK